MTDSSLTDLAAPIVKVVTVNAAPAQAFARFTADMAAWWPLSSHSVGERDAETVTMEGRVGGRIVERMRGGREAVWGTLTVWDPPHRVAFSWHPGEEPEKSTHVELRFTASGMHTRVELRHSGFERLGPLAARTKRMYPIGWAFVLGLYAQRRGPFIAVMQALTTTLMGIRRYRTRRANGAAERTGSRAGR